MKANGVKANDPHAVVSATYTPAVFDVLGMEEARSIILTPEDGRTTDERWEQETPYLLRMIEQSVDITPNTLVMDYGCGIGRIAKALIDRHGCWVVGVDISPSMRALATYYCSSNRFFACAPQMLDGFGIKADLVLSIWVLQHCFVIEQDIARIHKMMKPNASLFVVNENVRVIPAIDRDVDGEPGVIWVNDRKDQKQLLAEHFRKQLEGRLDPDVVTPEFSERTFCAVYRKD